jgi:hypothetical protein
MILCESSQSSHSLVEILSYLYHLQILEKNLPSQSTTKVWKHNAEEAEFVVAERTT